MVELLHDIPDPSNETIPPTNEHNHPRNDIADIRRSRRLAGELPTPRSLSEIQRQARRRDSHHGLEDHHHEQFARRPLQEHQRLIRDHTVQYNPCLQDTLPVLTARRHSLPQELDISPTGQRQRLPREFDVSPTGQQQRLPQEFEIPDKAQILKSRQMAHNFDEYKPTAQPQSRRAQNNGHARQAFEVRDHRNEDYIKYPTTKEPPAGVNDIIAENEQRDIHRSATYLAETWRKKKLPVYTGEDETDGGISFSNLRRKWEAFCQQEWVSHESPAAVRAFLSACISEELAVDIKDDQYNYVDVQPNRRSYYKQFYHYTLRYLGTNHQDKSVITGLIQQILTDKQGGRKLSDFFKATNERLRELEYCSVDKHSQLHPLHVGFSLQACLGAPFRSWWYDVCKEMGGSDNITTFDDLRHIMRALVKKAQALRQQRPDGYNAEGQYVGLPGEGQVYYANNNTNKNNQYLTLQHGHAPAPTTEEEALQQARQTTGKGEDSRVRQQNYIKDSRKPNCLRCFDRNGDHDDNSCPEEKPKRQHARCRCGSARHQQQSCPLSDKDLKCLRCHNDERAGLPHRSGMCPLSLEQLKKADDDYQQNEFMEAGSHPVATRICVGPRLLADVILDSGAGRCYGQARFLRWLAGQQGVQLTWDDAEVNNAVGPVGNSLDVKGSCKLVVWPQKAADDDSKVKIKIYVVERLIPQLIIGVSGLRLLRVGLMFGPDGIRGYSGLTPPVHLEKVDRQIVHKYMSKGTEETVNQEADNITCLFDTVNFVGLCDEPGDDYTQDLLIPAGVAESEEAKVTTGVLAKTKRGLSLIEALRHPLGTFRGIILDEKNSTNEHLSYRALHDFNWTRRPTPTPTNRNATERQAHKLFNTLSKKKLQAAYNDVIKQYEEFGHIKRIAPNQIDNYYYTPHFPVEKADNNRTTRIRPVYDWRRCNPLQRLPPPQDVSMWPSITVTRCYPFAAWSDLKNAYLFDRTPLATRRSHGFMLYEVEKGVASLRHYHFLGLPMGSSSSAAALQTTTGILMEISNEASVARMCSDVITPAAPIWDTLVDHQADEEELQGLPEEDLYGPSPAALALAEILQLQDESKKMVSAEDSPDGACNSVHPRWSMLWKSGSRRVKFVDDVTTGAQTKAQLLSLRQDEKVCAQKIGHMFNDAKEKHSDDDKSAEGFGLVWTGAAEGDQLKPRKVKISSAGSGAIQKLTVRNVLSLLHQAYDIIGVLSWTLMPIKLILRQCYTSRLQYDDFIPDKQTNEVLKTIDNFNKAIDETTIPRYIDVSRVVVLYADASAHGLGYAISNGNPREIYVASIDAVFNTIESIVRKETLALEHGLPALLERARDFPYSPHRVYYVLTDSSIVLQRIEKVLRHRSGVTKTVWKTPKGWSSWEVNHCKSIVNLLHELEQLAGAESVHFAHCPGLANLADGYSRGSNPFNEHFYEVENFLHELNSNINKGPALGTNHLVGFAADLEEETQLMDTPKENEVTEATANLYKEIVDAQAEDPYTQICVFLLAEQDTDTNNLSSHLQERLREWSHAERAKVRALFFARVEDGRKVLHLAVGRTIVENDESKAPLYIPETVRGSVISKLHSFYCHQPAKFLIAYAERHYYFKGLRKAIKAYSRSCPGCQRSRGPKVWPDTRPRVIPRDFEVNTVLALDWVGPARDPTDSGTAVPFVGGHGQLLQPLTDDQAPKYALHIYDIVSRYSAYYLAQDIVLKTNLPNLQRSWSTFTSPSTAIRNTSL